MAEYCHVADDECVNPPGYGTMGGIRGANPDPPRTRWLCPSCGLPACRKCRRIVGGVELCNNCAEDKERENV